MFARRHLQSPLPMKHRHISMEEAQLWALECPASYHTPLLISRVLLAKHLRYVFLLIFDFRENWRQIWNMVRGYLLKLEVHQKLAVAPGLRKTKKTKRDIKILRRRVSHYPCLSTRLL